MYDSPVRIKKVGTQTGHVWDTLRLTICKKCVIHNDWIFTTSEKHKPEQNGCFLFNVLPLRGNMGKISGIKILSQNETQVGRQHRNRVPNEWRERLFPYSILIAIRSIPQRCALTDLLEVILWITYCRRIGMWILKTCFSEGQSHVLFLDWPFM